MVYVMLSRVCALSQIYILDEFDDSKMYPNLKALEELERLDQISLNNNPTDWEQEDKEAIKIISLNCRSLNKHFKDITSDEQLLKGDIIALQETWLEDDTLIEDFDIPGYNLHLNSRGRGKGLATYFKSNIFKHDKDVKQDHMQLSRFISSQIDVITIYRSQECNLASVNQIIGEMIETGKPQLVVGDFNFCYMESSSNLTCKYLHSNSFKQLITESTHILS